MPLYHSLATGLAPTGTIRPTLKKLKYNIERINCIDGFMYIGCYGNASTRKHLNTEMPQKPVVRNFRFFLGNPSKLENVEGFPNIFEAFPNI